MDAFARMVQHVRTKTTLGTQNIIWSDPIMVNVFVNGDQNGLLDAVRQLIIRAGWYDDALRDTNFILMAIKAVRDIYQVDISDPIWDWAGLKKEIMVNGVMRPFISVSFDRS